MELHNLYRVERDDMEKLQDMLTECFENDPLYMNLIPEEETRKKLLPELFECDLYEMFGTSCEIYADSADFNGMVIVSDESEPYNPITFYLTEFLAGLRTDGVLIKEDHSLKTLWNFLIGKDYLNSKWTDDLHQDERLHIIYFAVRPSMQGRGIAGHMMREIIKYADEKELMVSLETHNSKNIPMYEHFGFRIFETVEKHFDLTQYCMVRNYIPKPASERRENAVGDNRLFG